MSCFAGDPGVTPPSITPPGSKQPNVSELTQTRCRVGTKRRPQAPGRTTACDRRQTKRRPRHPDGRPAVTGVKRSGAPGGNDRVRPASNEEAPPGTRTDDQPNREQRQTNTRPRPPAGDDPPTTRRQTIAAAPTRVYSGYRSAIAAARSVRSARRSSKPS